ncbi:hypothetical protein GCM10010922_23750 [Microbacterium sorbitolivorans]|uniref:DUF402 domain-containing protein n=1 Tax=Microbacterium sorbitolivorans TaxID=1867410 RepID=A0A367XTT5_9MICO|nr:DUF402 domain-containing protein [Microbacterium sorbitolivorans]RCK57035.1 DUF402 domain-containing protein [Microbacterium sorbitolivorans]GGF47190.1 hypothetical protein GCM10010922_23750 [Microbacterium sorbitolivorans]
MNVQRPTPGTIVRMQWRKWDGSLHWGGQCVYLGSDDRGDWLGKKTGWRYTRPGAEYTAENIAVTLLPVGHADHTVTFNRRHPRALGVYVDLAHALRWEHSGLVTGIDMDLDVVQRFDDRGIYIDDGDEWLENQCRYKYPLDVISHLETLAISLERRLRAHVSPFDGPTADAWLDHLEAAAVMPG